MPFGMGKGGGSYQNDFNLTFPPDSLYSEHHDVNKMLKTCQHIRKNSMCIPTQPGRSERREL